MGVLVNAPPIQICEGPVRGRQVAPENSGRWHGRSLVIWADRATVEKHQAPRYEDQRKMLELVHRSGPGERRGGAAPGGEPSAGAGESFFVLVAIFSTTWNVTGIRQTAMRVAASMPPMTTVPMMRRETAPAPVAVQSGTVPRMKANEVIR